MVPLYTAKTFFPSSKLRASSAPSDHPKWGATDHPAQRHAPARGSASENFETPCPPPDYPLSRPNHLLTDAQGIPLSLILTGANRHDITQLLPLVSAIPPVAGVRGAPRRKPALIQADRAYHSDPLRRLLASQGIGTQIARRGAPHGSGLGKTRWVVERTIAWPHQFRRLRVRYERLPSLHEAFLRLGACIICWRFLKAA